MGFVVDSDFAAATAADLMPRDSVYDHVFEVGVDVLSGEVVG